MPCCMDCLKDWRAKCSASRIMQLVLFQRLQKGNTLHLSWKVSTGCQYIIDVSTKFCSAPTKLFMEWLQHISVNSLQFVKEPAWGWDQNKPSSLKYHRSLVCPHMEIGHFTLLLQFCGMPYQHMSVKQRHLRLSNLCWRPIFSSRPIQLVDHWMCVSSDRATHYNVALLYQNFESAFEQGLPLIKGAI